MFSAAVITIVKMWKQPKCTFTDVWIKNKSDIYIKWDIIQPYKSKFSLCNYLDDP